MQLTNFNSSLKPTKKHLSNLLGFAVLVGAASSAFAADAPSPKTAAGFVALSAAPGAGGEVTCTDSAIVGDIGSSGFPSAVVQTRCARTGAVIAPVSEQVLTDFHATYDALATISCDKTLTGTLASRRLAPGVYCFDAAATVTGTLTLDGPSNGIWIFKIGTSGAGTLTGTNFSVVMANGALACNVYWRVTDAATMTTSDLKGTVLSGAAITLTGGTFTGRAMANEAVTLTGIAATGCSSNSDLLKQ